MLRPRVPYSEATKVKRAIEIARFVWRTTQRVERIKQRVPDAGRVARQLVEDTAEAGVVFVKMSQFISARGDVLDKDTVAALETLQNNVPCDDEPPVLPGYVIEPESIASASIASVFRATRSSDGKEVAVKRVRDGVKHQIRTDLPLLMVVLDVARVFNVPGAANMLEIVRECTPMLLAELDLRIEAKAQAAFRRRMRTIEWLTVPAVYEAGEEYMVSEFVQSRKVNEAVPNGMLADRLFELYLRMIVDVGVVHADPHAGNVGVRADGSFVLYDFGATIDVREARPYIARMLKCVATDDVEGAVRTLGDMGIIKPDAATSARLRRAMPKIKALAQSKTFNADLAELPEFTDNENRVFQLTTQYVYLIRSLVIVQGIIAYHDPTFDLARYVERYDDIISDLSDVSVWDVAREFAGDLFAAPAGLRGMQDAVSDMNALMSAELPVVKASLRLVVIGLLVDFLVACIAVAAHGWT